MKNDLGSIKNFEDIVLLYYRYKDTVVFEVSVISIIILASFFLLVKVVVPQVENWFSINAEVTEEQTTISQLRANKSALVTADDSLLNQDVAVVSSALPFQKDFTGVLNAVNAASANAGVVLDDYSFQVGNLSTKSAQLSQGTSLTLKLSLKGGIEEIQGFIKEIQQKLPLAEVVSTSYSENGSALEVLFFYKLTPKQTQVSYTNPLPILTGDKETLLNTLAKWKDASNGSGSDLVPVTPASGSAEPF
jgi:hypothetical protein